MRKKILRATILIIVLFGLLIGCTTPGISGSETTNGLRVSIVNGLVSGKTLPNNMVMCFSSVYNPDSSIGISDTLYADIYGNFQFDVSESVTYNLFTYSKTGDSCAILQNLNVTSGSLDTLIPFDSAINLNGKVISNDNSIADAKVFIVGTPFKTMSSADGMFNLNLIPNGTFTVKSIYGNRDTKGFMTGDALISPNSNNWSKELTIVLK